MRCWLLGVIALMLPSGASADAVSPAPDAVAVAIYHTGETSTADLLNTNWDPWLYSQGLAIVSETREIDLPAGPSEIRFRGVASTMVPQTADIEGLPEGVLERNFDYDLLSPGSLLAKSNGQTVRLVRTNPKTGKRTEVVAIIRTGPNGVMLEIDGKLEALNCSGLPERVILEKTPDGLSDVPTLAVRTNAPVAGHYRVRLSYLSTGLNWSADYVARIRPGGHSLDLTGWLTLANFGMTGFQRIPIQAIAGKLNLTGEDEPIQPELVALATQCWPTNFRWWTHRLPLVRAMDGMQSLALPVTALTSGEAETVVVTASRIADPRALGDYKLYTLPEPTDMPARQTKQVQFLDLHDVPFERLYYFPVDPGDESATEPTTAMLRFRNVADAGLGKALPAGAFAVMEAGTGGMPIFIGQSRIEDTPVGLPFETLTGDVFSVLVSHSLVEEKKVGSGDNTRTQRTIDYEIINDRAEPVVVELRAPLGENKVSSESRPHTVDRGSAVWRVSLTPGQRVQLRIGMETPY